MALPLRGGLKALLTTDMKGEMITELQVMRECTMHDDENVNRAVAGFSWIRSNSRKDVVLRACLN